MLRISRIKKKFPQHTRDLFFTHRFTRHTHLSIEKHVSCCHLIVSLHRFNIWTLTLSLIECKRVLSSTLHISRKRTTPGGVDLVPADWKQQRRAAIKGRRSDQWEAGLGIETKQWQHESLHIIHTVSCQSPSTVFRLSVAINGHGNRADSGSAHAGGWS